MSDSRDEWLRQRHDGAEEFLAPKRPEEVESGHCAGCGAWIMPGEEQWDGKHGSGHARRTGEDTFEQCGPVYWSARPWSEEDEQRMTEENANEGHPHHDHCGDS